MLTAFASLWMLSLTEYAIYMLDPDGLVTSWNAGAEHLKGCGAAEIIGQPYERFFPARISGATCRHISWRRRRSRDAESEGWRVRKDGVRFWASAILHKVQDKAGRHIGFMQVTRDITQRKATQDALLESERRFHSGAGRDRLRHLYDRSQRHRHQWNTGAERIKGYMADEIVGQHISRFYSREDRATGLPARGTGDRSAGGR